MAPLRGFADEKASTNRGPALAVGCVVVAAAAIVSIDILNKILL